MHFWGKEFLGHKFSEEKVSFIADTFFSTFDVKQKRAHFFCFLLHCIRAKKKFRLE